MNDRPIPIGAIRASFDRAAQAHTAARTNGPSALPFPDIRPAPASRAATLGAAHQIASTGIQVAPSVEQAIANASRQTGIDYDFLIAQAQVESAMNPDARARTSSASGLYQFIESTWLGTMQRHGSRFGLDNVAAQIQVTSEGSAYVPDPAARQAILALRNDPQIASFMAAGLAEDNRAHLAPILGRQPDHSEMYLAHFLGAGGAGRFLSEMAQNPNQSAADLFRRPAASNRPVFYDRSGSPRSLAGVMDYLSGKLERARANAPASIAQNAPGPITGPVTGSISGPVSFPDASPVMTNAAPRGISRSFAISAASAAPISPATPRSRGSMSNLLQSTFGTLGTGGAGGSSPQANQQIQRAYNQLKAMGL